MWNLGFLSTPSARRATYNLELMKKEQIFLSTPSARRATAHRDRLLQVFISISIHALREEGDITTFNERDDRVAISIHALREEGDT